MEARGGVTVIQGIEDIRDTEEDKAYIEDICDEKKHSIYRRH